jgi:ATP-binding cassette subfamily B multidrug efflux pump
MNSLISLKPDRLETVLGGSGVLSKGQQQLLCLARTLLQNRPIVILDESTSR